MSLTLPELSLVVLVGVSGAGKSTFARRHFKPTEILSSDFCRGLVSDDENCQAATKDAFEVLHFIARKRLAAGRLTVVDATNVQPEARRPLVALAREFHCLPVAIVLDLPERLAHERNRARPDRDFGPHVIRQQAAQLHRSLRGLPREGFRHVHVLRTPEQVEAAVIERQPLWNNLKHEHGPFDLIGDVHGCCDELVELLGKLGYEVEMGSARVPRAVEGVAPSTSSGTDDASGATPKAAGGTPALPETFRVSHPAGRKLVFLGDLVDRGPNTPAVLKLVMQTVADGVALCVPGNHDVKLMRKLQGRDVQVTHGLAESLAQLAGETEDFRRQVAAFVDDLVSHYVLDGGRLVVAHAGLKEAMHGRGSGAVRDFALYGETTGETDEFGLPVRHDWAAEYRGAAMVVYGHTPVPEPEWLNHTINIDTGCVFGGRLTALRYPEKELVSVPARQVYAAPAKPFPVAGAGVTGADSSTDGNQRLLTSAPTGLTAQQEHDDVLDLADVTGKRQIGTRLHGSVTVREENAAAALEVMSRFAVNPKWLIYLPPTMSPCGTSALPGLLEHPAEAFAYFRQEGVPRVICEEKHMGSRAVLVVCHDEDAARRRFGVAGEGFGVCCTRTGRRFFDDTAMEAAFLDRVRDAVARAGLWEELATDWLCLDAELMPWSAKAQALLRDQYAPVGTAAQAMLDEAVAQLGRAQARGLDLGELLARTTARQAMAADYVAAWRRYCWPVNSVDDLRLAPFHLLASEGKVHTDKPHDWHMTTLARLAGDGAPRSEPASSESLSEKPGAVSGTGFQPVAAASSPRKPDTRAGSPGDRQDACPTSPTGSESLPPRAGAGAVPILIPTPFRVVDVTDPADEAAATRWWEELTARGGEGMVVKPLDFIARGRRGLIQPAVKCRGREYLRLIYGPEYTAPENLERLRSRGLHAKRSLALREFALGLEALERFVRREPLRRVHECVFGVLALESEPVDPRL